MKTHIIDLSELRGEDEFPAYAALYSTQAYNPFLLSPTVMRWDENICLARLEDCKPFWIEQKKKLRCKLTELFAPLLIHHCGANYIAVFAQHPWQCLLYLYYQLRHQGRGLYLLQSRLDQNIYRTLGWDCWFDAQTGLADHLLASNARGFQVQSFHAQQARMQRFIQRIGVASPQDMNAADSNSITRRFGKWLGLVWQWSFTDASQLQWFPWISLATERLPEVKRDLDYPLNQWSLIEVLLREDLARLGTQFQRDDCVHINRMLWEITLFNDQKVAVELSFRHPYSLHRDGPDFVTALYQARYIYDDLARKLQTREHDLDLPENMPFLCWRIEVCERVLLAPQLWELFANEFDQIDYQQIMSLQNKLPIAFECFQASASFYPEQSFVQIPIGHPVDKSTNTALDHYPWSSSAVNKPLFYFRAPQPIENPLHGASPMQKFFLERNSSQWWLSPEGLQSIRDYFILKDHKGRCSWAFCNQDGAWFKQGEFC
ncbi:MAG: hypothetical protein LJE92_02720 [Gammaproteobacteria bacterium]|nr:hypothetical protein [Gammaproteobacteria bacterium]